MSCEGTQKSTQTRVSILGVFKWGYTRSLIVQNISIAISNFPMHQDLCCIHMTHALIWKQVECGIERVAFGVENHVEDQVIHVAEAQSF